jgi:predicted small secreted protein
MKNKIILLASVILTLISLISLTLVATGCKNTANGAGKDIENMGEKIQEKTQ